MKVLDFYELNVEVIIWAFDLPQLRHFFHFLKDLQGPKMSQNLKETGNITFFYAFPDDRHN